MLSTLSSSSIPLLVLLQLQAWSCGARILRARQNHGDDDSDSDSDSDTDSDSESCNNGVCTKTSCKRKVCVTVISTQHSGVAQTLPPAPGASGVPGSAGSLTTPAPNPTVTGNTNSHNTRSAGSLSVSANHSQNSSNAGHPQASGGISKGGIAGLVIGLLILVGLLAMCLAGYRKRLRRSKQKPRGFTPATFLTGTGITGRGNNTLNGQTLRSEFSNRSPVIAAVRNNIGRHNDNSYNTVSSSNSPLSPLLPAITPGYEGRTSPNPTGRNQTRSTRRSGDNTSLLTSPHSDSGDNYTNTPLPPLPHEATAANITHGVARNASAGPGPSSRAAGSVSPLHSNLRAYQKALEADNEKRTQSALEGSSSSGSARVPRNDPPPSYSR